MAVTAILPVKPFAKAKQRLSVQLSDGDRQALVVAMFSDVLVALGRSSAIDRVLVVTDDRVAEQLAAGYGAEVVPDGQASHSDAALVGLARARTGGAELAMLVAGDCPLLDPAELDALAAKLEALRDDGASPGAAATVIVPDRHGTGTNALALSLPEQIQPAFGPGSCQRHAAAAASASGRHEVVQVPTLALDVDTPDDLEALATALAARHGGAAHTRGMLAQLSRSTR